MFYTVAGQMTSDLQRWFMNGVHQVLQKHGHLFVNPTEKDIRLVFNFVDPNTPRPFRRKAQATYVISVVEMNEQPQNVLRAAYPTLIRALSNLLVLIVNTGDRLNTYFVTLEHKAITPFRMTAARMICTSSIFTSAWNPWLLQI
jgi:hypothetical protein